MSDISDNSLVAVALWLHARYDFEKSKHDAREHLAFMTSMSRTARNFGTVFNIMFPANPKAKTVSDFFSLFAYECEKDCWRNKV